MDQKLLIVVSLISGRNFPRRSECSLIIEANFNKEVLTSDPVPHVGGTLPINTELAWELTRKAFQQHKLSRTPIKIQCFALNKVTTAKENVGYVMLDLRTAHQKSQRDPNWHGVLNSPYSRLKPQLLLSLSLEVEEKESSKVKELTKKSTLTSSLSLTLDPSGDHYLLGSMATGVQEMFTLSLTLQNAKNLPNVPSGQTHCYFYYCLLGNDITSELFTPPTFPAERASIRIKSDRQTLSILMAAQDDIQIHLCSGSKSLCQGHLSLSPLKSVNRLDCTLPLSIGDANVEVIVQLEETSVSSLKQLHPPHHSPLTTYSTPSGKKGQGTGNRVKSPQDDPLSSAPSAKRNLALSFEDASLHASSNSSATVLTPSPSLPAPTTPPAATSSSPLTPEVPPPHTTPEPPNIQPPTSDTEKRSKYPNTSNSLPRPPSTADSAYSRPLPPDASLLVNDGGNSRIPQVARKGEEEEEEGVASTSKALDQGGVSVNGVSGVNISGGSVNGGVTGITQDHHTQDYRSHPSTKSARIDGASGNDHISEYRHFRYSIDLCSLHTTRIEPGTKCYLRYNYPFFGCPYPVLVQPPVILAHGPNNFKQSFCSFDFAASRQQLHHHTSHHLLAVEVWQSCDQSRDKIVGLSQINLSEVISQDKTPLENGSSFRQMYSLQPHITPPTNSNSSSSSSSLGRLHVVLVLEDFGPLALGTDVLTSKAKNSSEGVSSGVDTPHSAPGDHVTGPSNHMTMLKPDGSGHVDHRHGNLHGNNPGRALMESTEYAVAMELEMWKMAEEEAFKDHLQSLESSHMTQLGEEWRRREAQRQHLLRQKLDHYSTLEKQLHEGLRELQTQQKSLTERELKLSREKEKVLSELTSLRQQHELVTQNLKMQSEKQLEIERLKASEFQHQVESLKRQVRDLEVKVRSREAEFDKYRQELMLRPESKLQAELSIAQLEKAELERKLTSFSKSKQHYKEQWSRTLAELASSRHREQAAARDRLLDQQKELEAMRIQYFQHEQQTSLKQQISDVKKDMNRLQEHTMNSQSSSQKRPPPSNPHTPPPTPPPPPRDPSHPHPPHREDQLLSGDVARWIEERDILLQTGVYSSTDPTIQKLDSKIRETMEKIKVS